jgi:hypothetical protein
VAPGYVKGAGMYDRDWGSKSPMGTVTTVEKVVAKTIQAIERDRPEVTVSGALTKISDVMLAASPRLTYAIGNKAAYPMLRKEAERREALRTSGEREIPN